MKNIIEYLKDKIYYVMGATILIIVVLIIISSCSGSSSASGYEGIELRMKSAAEKYYAQRKNKLPKTDNGVVKVSLSTLIESELIKEITDPKDSSNKCSGFVEVTKIKNKYIYTPFLTCKGNYEPKYLHDKVKKTKVDEYGGGIYEIDGEYVYRGTDLKNYVSFNGSLWRIIKIDNEDSAYIIKDQFLIENYPWDTAYNDERKSSVGVTTNYLNTDIRRALKKYYEETFTEEQKARMVQKNLCVGKYEVSNDNDLGEKIDKSKECSIIKEGEYIGLITVSDFALASLDPKCTNVFSNECSNYNYLAEGDISTWTLNSSSSNTYQVFYVNRGVQHSNASNGRRINPVVFLNKNVIVYGGDGSKENPYDIHLNKTVEKR